MATWKCKKQKQTNNIKRPTNINVTEQKSWSIICLETLWTGVKKNIKAPRQKFLFLLHGRDLKHLHFQWPKSLFTCGQTAKMHRKRSQIGWNWWCYLQSTKFKNKTWQTWTSLSVSGGSGWTHKSSIHLCQRAARMVCRRQHMWHITVNSQERYLCCPHMCSISHPSAASLVRKWAG